MQNLQPLTKQKLIEELVRKILELDDIHEKLVFFINPAEDKFYSDLQDGMLNLYWVVHALK